MCPVCSEGYLDDAVTSIGVFSSRIPTVVTLYDLIPLLNPDIYLKPDPQYERYYLRKIESLKRASAWSAISEFTAGEGRQALGLAEAQITNISAACDPIFRRLNIQPQESTYLFHRFHITKPFVMYSGATDERKNLPRLIRAYAAMPLTVRSSHQLVLAGRMPHEHLQGLSDIGKKVGLGSGELIFTGDVTDDDLVLLYNLCALYVFPSWHEGFGLTPLEAMSCGAPVIASNTSSIPEVINLDAALFDPFSEESISEKLTHSLIDEDFRAKLMRHAILQAQKFSWNESARRVLSALEKVVSSSSQRPYQHLGAVGLIESIAAIKPFNENEQDLLTVAWSIATNQPPAYGKQLFVDISELVIRDAKTGIQRVTRSVLRQLIDAPPQGYRIEPVYASTESVYRYARLFIAKFLGSPNAALTDDAIEYSAGDVFLGLDLQHHVVSAQEIFYQHLRRHGVQIHFVIYDLLPLTMPKAFPDGTAQSHKKWLDVIAQGDGVICISKAVADELAGWLKANNPERQRPFKISWFHLGADIDNAEFSHGMLGNTETELKAIQHQPSFLMVGTIEPRKGHAQTIAAFEILWAQNIQANLVIVGKQGWMEENLIKKLYHHFERGKRLFWLEAISDEYLEKVYSASACLIAASEGEGFGLPLIEAAQHKLPIIARDIPVFREVAGEHAYYFSGKKPADLALAIKNWLGQFEAGQHPTSDHMPWLTWKESTERLKQILFNEDCYISWLPSKQVQEQKCSGGATD